MKNKWTGLPKFEGEKEWQNKVDEEKAQYLGLTTSELARAFALIKASKEALEDRIKILNITLEALSQLLIENLEDAEIQKVTLDSGATVYINSEPYSSVEDKEKLMAWIKKNRLTNMLMVHFKTLGALNKERLVNGKAPLPGTKVYIKTSARIRNASSKGENDNA